LIADIKHKHQKPVAKKKKKKKKKNTKNTKKKKKNKKKPTTKKKKKKKKKKARRPKKNFAPASAFAQPYEPPPKYDPKARLFNTKAECVVRGSEATEQPNNSK